MCYYTEGVNQLSRTEVRKDLDEIELLITGTSLSELDDIKILASFYPVKPRVDLKIPEHLKQQQLMAPDADSREVGDLPFAELLEFLRLVEVVRPDLHDAEREREQLESKYMVRTSSFNLLFLYSYCFSYFLLCGLSVQSIRDNFVAETVRQNCNNKQRYNYLRALQVLLCRKIAQYSFLGHHSSMLSDLLTVLEEKGSAVELLDQAVKAMEAVKVSIAENPATLFLPTTPSLVTSVTVKRPGGSTVLLHAGMRMDTPFGAGVVRAIRVTGIKAVEIDLPFGLLYSTPQEAIQWFSFVNDDSCVSAVNKSDDKYKNTKGSNRYLFHRWQDERCGLYLPLDVQNNIITHKDVVSRVDAAALVAQEQRLKSENQCKSAAAAAFTLAPADSFLSQLTNDMESEEEDEDDTNMDIDGNDADEENGTATGTVTGTEEGDKGEFGTSPSVLRRSANGLIDVQARNVVSDCLPYLFASSGELACTQYALVMCSFLFYYFNCPSCVCFLAYRIFGCRERKYLNFPQ